MTFTRRMRKEEEQAASNEHRRGRDVSRRSSTIIRVEDFRGKNNETAVTVLKHGWRGSTVSRRFILVT